MSARQSPRALGRGQRPGRVLARHGVHRSRAGSDDQRIRVGPVARADRLVPMAPAAGGTSFSLHTHARSSPRTGRPRSCRAPVTLVLPRAGAPPGASDRVHRASPTPQTTLPSNGVLHPYAQARAVAYLRADHNRREDTRLRHRRPAVACLGADHNRRERQIGPGA
jgi:hypothetical protein